MAMTRSALLFEFPLLVRAVVVQFFEIDLPEASLRKQKLVRQVLPDSKKVIS